MKKVLFIDEVHPILEELLSKTSRYECIQAWQLSLDEIKTILPNVHGIVLRSRFPMYEEFLESAVNLEFIARSGAGMENIDEHYCKKKNITLYNAPEGNRNAVGEQALGMLLSLMNKIATANRDVKNGLWQRDLNRGEEIAGKTVGIIGYGNNGSTFAKKLRGMDCRVLAYDKYKKGFDNHHIEEASLKGILDQADIISFHIPQNKETIYFANEEFFDGLAKPVYLLNLSRGKIVKTSALIQAIESGKVKAAALDVNEFEKSSFESFYDQNNMPKELKYLIESDKVLLTPHIGGWTTESYYQLSYVLAKKILGE